MQSVLGKSMCSAKGNLADNRQEDLGFQTTNLGRILAECNPYFSAVDVQINEKLSFETDVAVLFTFIVPNTLHILGLTSWSTCCCYMSINHFLGGRKQGLQKPCVHLSPETRNSFQPARYNLWHFPSATTMPCLSSDDSQPWVVLREQVTQMCHWKGSLLPKCSSAPLQRECTPRLPLPTPSHTVCSTLRIFWGLGFNYRTRFTQN